MSPAWPLVALLVGLGGASAAPPAPPPAPRQPLVPSVPSGSSPASHADGKACSDDGVQKIDLASSLRLAGVNNPQILIARQRVSEAIALRQLAAAQALPTLNLGTSYDQHS